MGRTEALPLQVMLRVSITFPPKRIASEGHSRLTGTMCKTQSICFMRVCEGDSEEQGLLLGSVWIGARKFRHSFPLIYRDNGEYIQRLAVQARRRKILKSSGLLLSFLYIARTDWNTMLFL